MCVYVLMQTLRVYIAMQALQVYILQEGQPLTEQEVHVVSTTNANCPWEDTVLAAAGSMEADISRASLLRALGKANECLCPVLRDQIDIRRSSAGDMAVLAKQDFQPKEIAMVPMVSGMAFVGLSSKRASGICRIHHD